jgi:hypothetical protein
MISIAYIDFSTTTTWYQTFIRFRSINSSWSGFDHFING